MAKSPLQRVVEGFGSKEALVKEIQDLFEKTDLFVPKFNKTKGLGRVSNFKLLRLHRMAKEVQERFGTRARLISSILEFEKRTNDADYRKRFERYTLGRLLDLHKQAERRLRRATKKHRPAKEDRPEG